MDGQVASNPNATVSLKGFSPGVKIREGSLVPTIFIGLGGFGLAVITRLKKAINTIIPNPDINKGFAFLVVDSHPNPNPGDISSQEYIAASCMVNPEELVERFPGLSWYSEIIGKYKVKNIEGANMTRAVGRLAFCNPVTLQEFIQKLNTAKSQVTAQNPYFKSEGEPLIVIISSSCGGTGAGMFLDVCNVTSNILGLTTFISPILVTPEGWYKTVSPVYHPRLCANTYSLLKDIMYLKRNDVPIRYVGIDTEENFMLPKFFNILHTNNEFDRVIFSDYQEIADAIVEYLIYQIIATQPEEKPRKRFGENLEENLDKYFRSIGISKVVVPINEIVRILTFDVLGEALRRELIPDVEDNIKSSVDLWIDKNNLGEYNTDQLQDAIFKDSSGNRINVDVDTEKHLQGIKRHQFASVCNDYIKSQKQNIEGLFRGVVRRNAEKLLKSAIEYLENEIERWGKFSQGSLLRFLELAKSTIEVHQNSLEGELSKFKIIIKNREIELKNSVDGVAYAAKSGIFVRKRRLELAIKAFDSVLDGYLNQLIKLWAMEEGLIIYKYLQEFIQTRITSAQQVVNIIKSRQSYIDSELARLKNELEKVSRPTQMGINKKYSLLNNEQIKQIFSDEIVGEMEILINNIKDKWHSGDLLNLPSISNEEWIEKSCSEVLKKISSKLNNYSIDKVLENYYSKTGKLSALFNNLKPLSSPLFPLEASQKEQAYDTEWIVVVEPSVEQNIKDYITRYLASDSVHYSNIPNPFEMIVYCEKTHYLINSLKNIKHYKANFENLMENYRKGYKKISVYPVHCLPNSDNWEDYCFPIPEKKKETMLIFILGRAFNYSYPSLKPDGTPDDRNTAFIYRSGNYYYFIDENKPIKLGNSLGDAIDSLEANPDWRNKIKNMIERKKEVVGIEDVRKKLENYIIELDKEIDNATKERQPILQSLKTELEKYIKTELSVSIL